MTPAKMTENATTSVTGTASQSFWPASVPTTIRSSWVRTNVTWARSRSPIEPLNSTKSTVAREPKAAKLAITGWCRSSTHTANALGMTTAARSARRSAA